MTWMGLKIGGCEVQSYTKGQYYVIPLIGNSKAGKPVPSENKSLVVVYGVGGRDGLRRRWGPQGRRTMWRWCEGPPGTACDVVMG